MKQLSLIILVVCFGLTISLSGMQSSSSSSSSQKRTFVQSNHGYPHYAQVKLGPSKTTIEYLSDSSSDDDSPTASTEEETPYSKRVRFNQLKQVTKVPRYPQSSLVSPYLQEAREKLEDWKNLISQLQVAIEENNAPLVQDLVDKMAIISNGSIKRIPVDSIKLEGLPLSALGFAASLGHLKTIKMLLALGADVNHRDQDGRTALDCAAWNNQSAALHVLLSVATLNQEHIETALATIQRYSTDGYSIDSSIIQALIEKLQTTQN